MLGVEIIKGMVYLFSISEAECNVCLSVYCGDRFKGCSIVVVTF